MLITDHDPLKWVQSTKTDNARIMHCALAFQTFNFSIEHCPSRQNVMADFLLWRLEDEPGLMGVSVVKKGAASHEVVGYVDTKEVTQNLRTGACNGGLPMAPVPKVKREWRSTYLERVHPTSPVLGDVRCHQPGGGGNSQQRDGSSQELKLIV